MIKKGIIILSLFLPCSLWAQNDSNSYKRPYISVNAGCGIPNFTLEALSGPPVRSSYATAGYTVNISGEVPIAHSSFGIIGSASYSAQPFDVNECFLQMCVSGNTDDLISGSYSDYKEMLLMAGVYLSPGEKSAFNLKLLVGANIGTLAGYSFYGTSSNVYGTAIPGGGVLMQTDTRYITASVQAAHFSALVCDFGMDWRFLQRKHLIGLLSFDYMYSQAEASTSYNNGADSPQRIRVTYNLLSLTAGIGYKF